MKRVLFIILFLIFSSSLFSQSANEWNFVDHLPQNDMHSFIQIPGTSKLIAVGDAGTIMLSLDNGLTWDVQYLIQFQHLTIESVFFIDSLTGYLGGGTGFVFKTEDAGQTWNELHIGSISWVNAIYFSSINVGYVACSDGTITKTIDGGLNWSTLTFPSSYPVIDIYFSDDYKGYACVDFGGLYYTSDGGSTWLLLKAITTQYSVSFQYFNDSTFYVSAHNGLSENYTYKTFDGGITWDTAVYPGSGYIFFSTTFTSIDTGYATSFTSVYKTTNGGLNWIKKSLPTLRAFSVDFRNSTTGIICGSDGMLFETTDSGNNWLPLTDTIQRTRYVDLFFQNDSTGLILSKQCCYGSYGITCRIMRTTDGGLTLDTVATFPITIFVGNLIALSFMNDSVGIATMVGTYAKTTDGGLTWSILSLPFSFSAIDIQLFNDSLAFAVGNYGKIAKSTDGAVNWMVTTLPAYPSATLESVFFINDSIGFISGKTSVGASPGLILKTTDRGTTWSSSIVGLAPLSKIIFVNDSVGFASDSYYGGIYKTIDQGQNWYLVTSSGGIGLLNMSFPSDSVGYCTGRNGRILKTEDQGETWMVQYSKSSYDLQFSSFTDEYSGYCISGLNSLIHINGDNYVCPKSTFSPSTLNTYVGDTINFGFYFYYWQINSETTYSWDFGDGSIDSLPYVSHAYNTGGDYTVTFVVRYKDCIDSSSCVIHIDMTTNLIDLIEDKTLTIFPNPTKGELNLIVKNEFKKGDLEIYDVFGKLVLKSEISSAKTKLEMNYLSSGIYFIKVQLDEKIITRKIIIQ